MADFLNGFVKTVLDETIKTEYPHIRHPALVYAKVTEVMTQGGIFYVTLQVLKEDTTKDEAFPLIPFVRTELEVQAGDIMIIGLLYGGCVPYILGRYHDD